MSRHRQDLRRVSSENLSFVFARGHSSYYPGYNLLLGFLLSLQPPPPGFLALSPRLTHKRYVRAYGFLLLRYTPVSLPGLFHSTMHKTRCLALGAPDTYDTLRRRRGRARDVWDERGRAQHDTSTRRGRGHEKKLLRKARAALSLRASRLYINTLGTSRTS